jgi:hypothetical protein
MGTAVIAQSDQFRAGDFSPERRRPRTLDAAFVGFFGSLEDLNRWVRRNPRSGILRRTPGHLI